MGNKHAAPHTSVCVCGGCFMGPFTPLVELCLDVVVFVFAGFLFPFVPHLSTPNLVKLRRNATLRATQGFPLSWRLPHVWLHSIWQGPRGRESVDTASVSALSEGVVWLYLSYGSRFSSSCLSPCICARACEGGGRGGGYCRRLILLSCTAVHGEVFTLLKPAIIRVRIAPHERTVTYAAHSRMHTRAPLTFLLHLCHSPPLSLSPALRACAFSLMLPPLWMRP